MKPLRVAFLLFIAITVVPMSIISAVAVWPLGWHYSSNALLNCVGFIVMIWNGDRL